MATRKKPEVSPAADKLRTLPMRTNAEFVNTASERSDTEAQLKSLEEGLRLFRAARLAEARECFQRAAIGPQRDVGHTARSHISVCERRLQKPVLDLQTAHDHYNYGVERLNARDLEAARRHLEVALALDPDCDYMLYALAAALALSGDSLGCYENLKRAIEREPRNRTTARHDPDFASVVHTPLFMQMLQPHKS